MAGNNRSDSTVITLLKNNVASALAITFLTNATGNQNEITTEVTVAEDDLFEWRIVTGAGTGSISFSSFTIEFHAD